MINRPTSFRFIVISFAIIALCVITIAANWGSSIAALNLFAPAESASSSSGLTQTQLFTPGTCDTAGPIEVEGSILGTTPTAYATLGAAFAAINGGTHTGAITIDVCGNTDETTVLAVLNASGSGAASYTSIAMSPAGGAARTISGATTAGSPMIDLNGADNVTINGLNTGGNSLTIANTTVSATSGTATIRFIGGATGNTITNSNIQGSGTMSVATNGANIFFSTDANTANGNDNNTISNNNIGPAGANLPTKGILGNGSTTTTAIGNSGNIIDNNNIFDYFGAAVTSAGIATNGGCNTWSITNNRFYQTGTRTWTTGALHNAINIGNTTTTSGAQGFTITGNIVGFASNTQTGTYALTGSTGTFRGIVFNGISLGTVSNINNNTVASVSVTGVTSSGTSSGAPFMGIYVTNGVANSNSNTIGSQSVTGSLTYATNSASAADVMGFFNFSVDTWTANNNLIGGITSANAGAGAANAYGMRLNTSSTVTTTLSGNTIGGTVADSIQSTSTATGTQVAGIFVSTSIATVSSNTIRNLTAAGGTGTTTAASVVGIDFISATPVNTASQNTIFNLSNTNATAASVVTGIQFTGGTGNVVERNSVYGLTTATNSSTAEVNGIRVAGGTTIYRNNMIAVGLGIANAIGSAASNSGTSGVNGINEFLGTNSFFHNSVLVRGAPTAGVGGSYAFNGTQTVNTRSFRDNIFFNARSNSGATGSNYAVKINGTTPNPTGLTINNNVYFANGTGGVFGFFNSLNVANLAAWKTAVGQDVGSFESNPVFVDIASGTPDLHINPTLATVVEGNGVDVGVTNDFDGQTRASFTPVDIGADAGNFSGVDLSAPGISYAALGNTSLTTNRALSVTITDVTGVATGGLAPRVYFNKNAGTYFSTACSLSSGTTQNGVWACAIDNTLIGGVVATDVVRYFVVAQDTLGNLAANPGGGFTGTDVNTVTTPPTTPNQYTIVAAISGSINVGSAETITSLTNTGGIFDVINNSEVTGNITINLTSDLVTELGTVALNEFASPFTILIKPSGAPRTITGTNTGALIRLNGADRVRIDGSTASTLTDNVVGGNPALRELTIQNTNAGTSVTVISVGSGTNGAQNNTIKNVRVLGQDPLTSLIGISLGATTPGLPGTDNDDNRVENCFVGRTIFGIYSAGASLANQNTGTVITQNETSAVSGDRIRRVGIVVFNDNGVQITENSINGVSTNESADGIGIGVGTQGIDNTNTTAGGVTNALVARNKINGIASLSTTGFSAAGITVAGAVGGPNTIANNMITGVTAPSTSPDIVAGIYVVGATGSATRIYHNSIAMTGDRGAVATQMPSFGVAITGTDPTVELKNNIFYTTQIASGGGVNAKSYAIGMVTTTFVNLDSNYNDFWSTGANDGGFRSGSLTTGAGLDYADISAWRTAVSDDLNSLEADPTYVDPLTDLHLLAGSPMIAVGTALASVTNDFDGDGRPGNLGTEIGADELADTNSPDTQILTNPTNPSNSASATFTFSGTDSAIAVVASFECQLDAASFATCTSPATYNSLSPGSHTFSVRAKDFAGNVDPSPASYTWVVDAIAPDTQILTNPPDPSNSSSAAFTFSGTDSAVATVASFECKLDIGSFAACTSPQNYTMLSQGSHTFEVRAIDGAGNIDPTPASYTWVVDAIAPDTQILTTPSDPSNSSSAAFTFSGTDSAVATVASFECKLDAGAFAACTSPQNYTMLADGSHTFQVRAVDAAGNVDLSPASYTWTISTGPVGPVSVTATAGTTGPTAYPTLKDAFDAVNAGTHQGAVTVLIVASTTETASAVLNNSGAGAASYTSVLVRPNAVVSVTGNIVGAVIKLNGADNVTIDGRIGGTGTNRDLTVANTSTSGSTAAIWLASVAAGNGASNNTIRNLELAAGATQNTLTVSTFGIIMCGTTISTTANGVDNDNNSFLANRIIRARYGIVTRGTTTDLNISPVVTDNIIGPAAFGADQIGKVGIFMQADTGALVSRNTVQFVGGAFANTTSGADRVGIGIGSESWSMTPGTLTSNTYTVTRNIVRDVIEERTFSSVGINLGTTGGGSATNNLVANNFIFNVKSNGTSGDQAVGLGIAGGLGDRVVFNSISMTGDVDPDAGAVATTNFGSGIRVGNNTGSTHGNLTLSNNSVYMDLSSSSAPTARYYAISGPINTFNWGTGGENYNNLYINPANTQLQTGGLGTTAAVTLTTQFATLANWQTAYTTPAAQDANSIQADPLNVSNTADLHIAVASPNVNAGLAVSGVTRDIDNQIRVAAPDIGADEPSGTAPAANDIEASVILVPANGAAFSTGATTTPQARFTNVGSATQTMRTVTFTIISPGGLTYSNSQTIASIGVDEVVNVTFPTTPPFPTAGIWTMTASTAADSNTGNDSVAGSFIVFAPITGGTVNVGTGEAYTSLTNPGGVFQAINSGVVTSNITVNITSNLSGETGAVTLNEIAGSFTTLIKPSGAARTISGAAPAAGGLLGFNSTDRVTIDGSLAGGTDRSLTVMPSNTANNGGGIYFASGINGAQNNVIKNVNVFSNGSITGTLLGISFASSTFGGVGIDNDNNRIENNDVRGSFYGIASLGASAANKDTGLVITKNVMPATGTAGIGRVGIYVVFADGAQITENNIASVSNPGAADTIGIAAGSQALSATPLTTGGISNALISRNYVGVVSNNATFSAAGIVVASDVTGTNTVVNNMVTGVIGNSNAGDIVAGIYVNGLAGSTQNIYHNSVSMTGDRLPITANMLPSYALAIATDQPTNVRDNVLVNSQTRTGSTGGGGESYAIGFDGPAANVNLLSNNNDLFVSGPLGVIGITGDLTTAAQTTTAGTGTNQATLAAWQTATTEDANSISVDPLFISLTDLHISPSSPLIDAGASVGVTTDFDGQTRDATPDIGADEVLSPGTIQFSSATYSVGEAGPTVTLTVTRTGGSGGAVTANYALGGGTATGGAACGGAVDYVNTGGSVVFADGDAANKTFTVAICDDIVYETPNETFNATLSIGSGTATIGTPNPATVTIIENDPLPITYSVSIGDVRLAEGNGGSTNAVFNVTLTANTLSPGAVEGIDIASVQYSTANGTATAGSDYTTTTGTRGFPSTGTFTVSVPVNPDTVKEANEFFFVNLSSPSPNTTIVDGQGVAVIVDEDRPYVSDFDGDRFSDYSVFRPSEGRWYARRSSDGSALVTTFGTPTDRPVPGDYDADGKTDLAFYRPSTSAWHILKSSNSTVAVFTVGAVGDKPVQGDYNGDGQTDLATFRPSSGLWSTFSLVDGSSTSQLFGISTDLPVQADYDGDAKTDIAVYRNGVWYVLRSSDASVLSQGWGSATDKPVTGDFDGDGRFDLAIFRPSSGEWWIARSLSGTPLVVNWGVATDIPAPADYDRDGTTDIAVFRPSSGDWYVLRSSTSTITGVNWGLSGDIPVPSAYLPQ